MKTLGGFASVLLVVLCGIFGGCSSSTKYCGCGSKLNTLRSPYFGGLISYDNPEELKPHNYNKNYSAGMLYTANAGYIDLGHLREGADRVKCNFDTIYPAILKGEKQISFRIIEPARYHISVKYPPNWKDLTFDQKQNLAKEISLDIAEYVAHKSLIWHEIITWYGYSCVRIFPEKPSSFSWEDVYSDVLGCRLGRLALEMGGNYNKNMTLLIKEELKKLNVQSAEVAKSATDKIQGRGKWFWGGPYPFIVMNRRNFNVFGTICPWLVPGVCNGTAIPLPSPNLDFVKEKGFFVKVKLEPKTRQGKRASGIPGKVCPEKDFPRIVEKIRAEAIKERGENVDKPIL